MYKKYTASLLYIVSVVSGLCYFIRNMTLKKVQICHWYFVPVVHILPHIEKKFQMFQYTVCGKQKHLRKVNHVSWGETTSHFEHLHFALLGFPVDL